jgi:hypothetical protein
MDIQAEINWIHQEIDKVKDPSFIEKLKRLLQSINSTNDSTNVEYNLDIDNALENIKKGRFYSDEEAKAISKKWGRK